MHRFTDSSSFSVLIQLRPLDLDWKLYFIGPSKVSEVSAGFEDWTVPQNITLSDLNTV